MKSFIKNLDKETLILLLVKIIDEFPVIKHQIKLILMEALDENRTKTKK